MTDDEIRDFLAWDGSGIDPEDFPSSLDGDLVELSPDRGVCFRGTAGGAAGWLDQHAKGPHSNFAFHARPRWTATTWERA